MKSKTPIISLAINPDELFSKNEVGIFCENNIKMMESNLNLLLKNNDLYTSISQKAFEYVRGKHDIKKIGQEWSELIYSISNK